VSRATEEVEQVVDSFLEGGGEIVGDGRKVHGEAG